MQRRRPQNYSNPQTSQVHQSHPRNQNPIFRTQNFNQNFQRPQFPSQPINLQPRNLPPQRFLTNQHIFGKPNNFNNVNVFKPNNNFIPRNSPTPMSTQSRIPSLQSNHNLNQHQNSQRPLSHSQIRNNFPWFKPSPKLNYVSEELNNVENELTYESPSGSFEISDPEEQQFVNEYPPNEFPEYYADGFLEYLLNTPDNTEAEQQQNFTVTSETQPLM